MERAGVWLTKSFLSDVQDSSTLSVRAKGASYELRLDRTPELWEAPRRAEPRRDRGANREQESQLGRSCRRGAGSSSRRGDPRPLAVWLPADRKPRRARALRAVLQVGGRPRPPRLPPGWPDQGALERLPAFRGPCRLPPAEGRRLHLSL